MMLFAYAWLFPARADDPRVLSDRATLANIRFIKL